MNEESKKGKEGGARFQRCGERVNRVRGFRYARHREKRLGTRVVTTSSRLRGNGPASFPPTPEGGGGGGLEEDAKTRKLLPAHARTSIAPICFSFRFFLVGSFSFFYFFFF